MPLNSQLELTSSQPVTERPKIAQQWGGDKRLFADGFLVVPARLLRGYATADVPLTSSEVMFLLHLLSHKWTAANPYPSYQRIGKLMGVSARMARRYAESLEKAGYLSKRKRRDGRTEFDLSSLFARIPSFPMTKAEGLIQQGQMASMPSKTWEIELS